MRVGGMAIISLPYYAIRKGYRTEWDMKAYRRFQSILTVLAAANIASGCTSPDTYKYKMSPYTPASSSLWDSYTDPLSGWWSDTKKLFKSGMETNFTPMGPPKASAAYERRTADNYARYLPLYLKVYKISVIEEYKSPKHAPNVEHLLPTTPAEAVESWAGRLRTSGGPYNMEVVVRDGSVISTPVPLRSGEDPASAVRRYDARLEVEISIYDRGGKLQARVASTANRSAFIREQASAEDRQHIFHHMLLDLVDTANGDLERKMYTSFRPYIDFTKTA